MTSWQHEASAQTSPHFSNSSAITSEIYPSASHSVHVHVHVHACVHACVCARGQPCMLIALRYGSKRTDGDGGSSFVCLSWRRMDKRVCVCLSVCMCTCVHVHWVLPKVASDSSMTANETQTPAAQKTDGGCFALGS